MSEIKMPFGKHRGKDIETIPADYLIWLYENKDDLYGDIKDYIVDNLDELQAKAKLLRESYKKAKQQA